jgi:hypothetical protein
VPPLDKSEIRLNMIPKTGPTAQNLSGRCPKVASTGPLRHYFGMIHGSKERK